MQRLCKEQRGPVCTALIDREICANKKGRVECRAKNGESGEIDDAVYEEILAELGMAPERAAVAAAPAARRAPAPVAAAAPAPRRAPVAVAAPPTPPIRRVPAPVAAARRAPLAAAAPPTPPIRRVPTPEPVPSPVLAPVGTPLWKKGVRLGWKVCKAGMVLGKDGICFLAGKIRYNLSTEIQNKDRDIAAAQAKVDAIGLPKPLFLIAAPIVADQLPNHATISRGIQRLVDNINSKADIQTILKNTEVKDALREDIDKVGDNDLKGNMIRVYELVTSKNFLTLLNADSVPITIDEIAALQRSISESIQQAGVYVIFNEVLTMMDNKFEPAPMHTDPSMVYLSNANSERSQLLQDYLWDGKIADAGFSSFDSILRNFGSFRVFPRTSASPTLIFSAKFLPAANSIKSLDIMRPTDIFFKCFPRNAMKKADGHFVTDPRGVALEHEDNVTGVIFEKTCYTELFKLQQYNVTPNILCTVASAEIDDFDKFINSKELSPKFKTDVASEIIKYNTEYTAISDVVWKDVSLIMTQSGGESWGSVFDTLSNGQRKSVMFQLLYNLYVFEKIEFSHGDLHTGNIFIVDIPETEFCYLVDGQQFKIRTNKLVKMYDFDGATICKSTNISYDRNKTFRIIQSHNPNRDPGESFNTDSAQTNVYNKNLDIVIFMMGLLANIGNPSPPTLSFYPGIDDEFDTFCQTCFPGMVSGNPTSGRTIGDTFREERRIHPSYETEYQRITEDNVDANYLAMEWVDYFELISFQRKAGDPFFDRRGGGFGRIIKADPDGHTINNHLWIPDSVILPRVAMLRNDYFRSFRKRGPIDIRRQIVYTIDNRT